MSGRLTAFGVSKIDTSLQDPNLTRLLKLPFNRSRVKRFGRLKLSCDCTARGYWLEND